MCQFPKGHKNPKSIKYDSRVSYVKQKLIDSASTKKYIVYLNNNINHSNITDIYRIFHPTATKYITQMDHSLVRPHSGTQDTLLKLALEVTQNMFSCYSGTQLEINNKNS